TSRSFWSSMRTKIRTASEAVAGLRGHGRIARRVVDKPIRDDPCLTVDDDLIAKLTLVASAAMNGEPIGELIERIARMAAHPLQLDSMVANDGAHLIQLRQQLAGGPVRRPLARQRAESLL